MRTYKMLRIDIDKDFQTFHKWIQPVYEKYIHWLAEKLKLCIEGYTFRRSTNNNTHAIIYLCQEPENLEEYVMLIAAFHCDLSLVSLSWTRLRLFGDPIVRLFDKKIRKPAREKPPPQPRPRPRQKARKTQPLFPPPPSPP